MSKNPFSKKDESGGNSLNVGEEKVVKSNEGTESVLNMSVGDLLERIVHTREIVQSPAPSQINEVVEQLTRNENKIGTVITPEDFGAVGNGVKDDIDAFDKAMVYAEENNLIFRLNSKTYGISRTFYVRSNVQVEGISNATIKALNNFTGDAVLASYRYNDSNLYSCGLFNISIDGNWKNVHGIKIKAESFGYDDLLIVRCMAGGLSIDRNYNQKNIGRDPKSDLLDARNYKNGRIETRSCGGTSVYWNHQTDTWIGDIECRGIDHQEANGKRVPGADESKVSKLAVHIGPQGQCEINRVHVYGFIDCMKVESRIAANLLILESYFDSALIMEQNSVNSQLDRVELFQNLTPTGNFTGMREGRNNVPVMHIKTSNIQINNLYIRQRWADPEKINDASASTNASYRSILEARRNKVCLLIDGNFNAIKHISIEAKERGALDLQKYYPIGIVNNGVHNRIKGQVNFCGTGLVTKSRDTGYNDIDLNFYHTLYGWKNTLGKGSYYKGNKYNFQYHHDIGGDLGLFHPDWQDIDLSIGERMKYTWTNGTGEVFTYPSYSTKTYDLSTVFDAREWWVNATGKTTKDIEVDVQVMSPGNVKAVKNCSILLDSHTKYGSNFHFSNSASTPGATAIVRVKIGLE